jgi:hypothetical protein
MSLFCLKQNQTRYVARALVHVPRNWIPTFTKHGLSLGANGFGPCPPHMNRGFLPVPNGLCYQIQTPTNPGGEMLGQIKVP